MKVVTASEMRDIDRKTIQEMGIPGLVLMERAGFAVVTKIKERFGRRRIVVLAGNGNNGGDGLVVARILHNEQWDVRVFLSGDPRVLMGEALSQHTIARNCGVSIEPVSVFMERPSDILGGHALIVDALLGTGLSKDVSGVLSEVIDRVNKLRVHVVSVDIPSGISSDDGQIMGNAVRADCTVTFGLPKRGHLLYPGADHTGRLYVEEIGFPHRMLTADSIAVDVVEKNDLLPLIPARKKYSHKGDYGHVLIVAGSKGKTGAALMAAEACLRAGAGLVTMGVPDSLGDVFQSRVTEEMILTLPDRGDGSLSEKAVKKIRDFLHEKADLLAIGPGIGVSGETERIMTGLLRVAEKTVVVDADGINSIKRGRKAFSGAKAPVILTPHPGEMARLLGGRLRDTVSEIEKDRIKAAQSFSRETGVNLVLKGAPTVTSSPEGRIFINPTGNPGMATAGAGDVLTGTIAGLLGQNMNPIDACILGVYLHGLAGDMASADKGPHSMTATDIIDKIPSAFSFLKSDE
ncbi:MAG: NAD(P)H-hydrate dehydratase [Nitrospirota bacterium]